MKKIIIYTVIWLVVVNIFGLMVLNRLNLAPDTAHWWIKPTEFYQVQDWNIIDMHARWDSYWYLDIAQNGYYLRENDTLANVVFFPLYPFLMKVLSFLVFGNLILAGWFLSSVFLILAVGYLYKLVLEFHKDLDPKLVLLMMLTFPTAFFFNAVYTESLFLFLSVVSFYYALKKNFLLAGIFG